MTDSNNGLKKVQIGSSNVRITGRKSVLARSPACKTPYACFAGKHCRSVSARSSRNFLEEQ